MPETPRQSKESTLVELCQRWLDTGDDTLADDIDEQLGGISPIMLFRIKQQLSTTLPIRQTEFGPQLDHKRCQGSKQIKIPLPIASNKGKAKRAAKAKKKEEEKQQCVEKT
ncbi:MAG: hypothetical protein V1807_00135 [Patescibacteria group bacterium]